MACRKYTVGSLLALGENWGVVDVFESNSVMSFKGTIRKALKKCGNFAWGPDPLIHAIFWSDAGISFS
jgi:hypothetical protein